MGLIEQQQALAQLYTNADLRERFFANPQSVSRMLGFSTEVTQQLTGLSYKEIQFFAESLLRKRFNITRKLLPQTHRILGDLFRELFMEYANTQELTGIKKHYKDAYMFSAFVMKSAQNRIEESWVIDLLRYETASLKAADPSCRLILRWFRYPIQRLVGNLVRWGKTARPQIHPTFILWFRFPGRNRLIHLVIPLPHFFSYTGQRK